MDTCSFEIKQFSGQSHPSPLDMGLFVDDGDVSLLDPSFVGLSGADAMALPVEREDMVLSPSAEPLEQRRLFQLKNSILLQKAGPRRHLYYHGPSIRPAIITCGGLCPALNNVVRALVNCLCHRYGVREVYGFKYGYAGLGPGGEPPIILTPAQVRDIHKFGGSQLGTSRCVCSAGVLPGGADGWPRTGESRRLR